MYKIAGIASIIYSFLCPFFMLATMVATRGTQDTSLFIGWAVIAMFHAGAGAHLVTQK
jgi:hypothetical protein